MGLQLIDALQRESAICSRRNRGRLSVSGLYLILVLTLSPCAATQLLAQSGSPVTIAVGTHSLTVPWHTPPVTYRLNPALLVGTDTPLKSGESWKLLLAVNLGFFRHHWWMTGVSLEPEVGVGRALPGGLYTDLRLGVGYMHYFWRRPRLELVDGRYVPDADWGNPSLIVPLSATVAYRGDPGDPLPVSPFVSARWGVQGLFRSEVAVATHLFLLGGVRLERRRANGVDGR